MGQIKFFALANLILFAALLGNSMAQAASDIPQTITLDGKLYNGTSTTSGLSDPSVDVVVQILSADKTCILYEEEQLIDTRVSDGLFNIQIGSIVSDAKRSVNDSNNPMALVFQNLGPIPAKGTGCVNPYTPSGSKERYVRLIVTPTGGTPDTLSPDMLIDAVPNALVAETLQGKDATGFLQLGNESLTQANAENIFTNANYGVLTSLLSGSSPNYVQVGSSGASLPGFASAPGSPVTGSVWYDTSANVLKFYDGSQVQTVSENGHNAVQNVVAGTGLNGGSISASGTISLSNTAVTAGTYGTSSQVPQLTVDAQGRITAAGNTSVSINAGTALTGTLAAAQMPAMTGDATSSAGSTALTLANTAVTAGTYGSSSQIGVFTVDTKGRLIAAGNTTMSASNITTGILPIANGGTGSSNGSISAPGPLTFAAGGSNQNVILSPSGSGNTLLGANVGIGTTTPGYSLDVVGSAADYVTKIYNKIDGSGVTTQNGLLVATQGGASNITIAKFGSGSATGVNNVLTIGATNLTVAKPINSSSGISVDGVAGYSFTTGDTDGGLFSPADGVLQFKTNATERMRIDPSGYAGIGTTSPQSLLHVYGSSAGEIIQNPSLADGGGVTQIMGQDLAPDFKNGFIQFLLGTAASSYNDSTMRISLNGDGANGLFYGKGGVVSVTGKVGVGTTSPTQALQVNGTGLFTNVSVAPTNANRGAYFLGLSGDFNHAIYNDYSNIDGQGAEDIAKWNAYGGVNVRVGPAGTNSALYVAAAGNIGVGTTSPAAKLDVNGYVIHGKWVTGFAGDCNNGATASVWQNVLSAPTYTKLSATSKLYVEFTGSLRANFNNSGNWWNMRIAANGGAPTVFCAGTSSSNDDHSTFYCRAILSGIAAGAVTLQPQLIQATSSWYCFGAVVAPIMTVEEIY